MSVSHENSRFSDPDYDPDRLTALDDYDGPDYWRERDEEIAGDSCREDAPEKAKGSQARLWNVHEGLPVQAVQTC